MSTSAAPNGQTGNLQQPQAPEGPPDPKIRGESKFDRVSSMLMAVVIGAFVIVGWLSLVYFTNQAYATRVTTPLEIVDFAGTGGGSPDGTPGSVEKIDVPGAEAAAQASNNEEVSGDFEEPTVQETPAAMLDAVSEAGESMAEVDISAVMPSGFSGAPTGKKASRQGTGGRGLGSGPGDGGVSREQRWSIIYNPGQTLQEYAAQLDALRVELAIVDGTRLIYVSNFSQATPTTRYGTGQGDDRLYFAWAGRVRKASDLALLQKAGLQLKDDTAILQFYPKEVENQLALLERRFKGRQASEIRVTRFGVVPEGGGYAFKVLAQETLR